MDGINNQEIIIVTRAPEHLPNPTPFPRYKVEGTSADRFFARPARGSPKIILQLCIGGMGARFEKSIFLIIYPIHGHCFGIVSGLTPQKIRQIPPANGLPRKTTRAQNYDLVPRSSIPDTHKTPTWNRETARARILRRVCGSSPPAVRAGRNGETSPRGRSCTASADWGVLGGLQSKTCGSYEHAGGHWGRPAPTSK